MIEKIANCTDFSNHSQYIIYEWVNSNKGPMISNCYDIRTFLPPQLLPMQYQGWFLLVFLIVGTIAAGYGVYIVATDDHLNKNQKTDPNRYYYMTEDEIKKIFS